MVSGQAGQTQLRGFRLTDRVDVSANRSSRKWSRREQVGRVLWGLATPLFRLAPRPFWGWRRMLLRVFGAKVGLNVHIAPTVHITIPWNLDLGEQCAVGERANLYALGTITIGPRATVSQGAHLCAGTHDWRDPTMPLMKPSIDIGADAWVCADAFIGPNVKIGDNAIVGARAVATKNVPPGKIVIGNPAKEIGERNP